MADADRMDTPEQAEFRAYCRQWLSANHPGQPPVRIPLGALELVWNGKDGSNGTAMSLTEEMASL